MGVAVHQDKWYCTCGSIGKTTEDRIGKLEKEVKYLKQERVMSIADGQIIQAIGWVALAAGILIIILNACYHD